MSRENINFNKGLYEIKIRFIIKKKTALYRGMYRAEYYENKTNTIVLAYNYENLIQS
jgi:hypothetical protein